MEKYKEVFSSYGLNWVPILKKGRTKERVIEWAPFFEIMGNPRLTIKQKKIHLQEEIATQLIKEVGQFRVQDERLLFEKMKVKEKKMGLPTVMSGSMIFSYSKDVKNVKLISSCNGISKLRERDADAINKWINKIYPGYSLKKIFESDKAEMLAQKEVYVQIELFQQTLKKMNWSNFKEALLLVALEEFEEIKNEMNELKTTECDKNEWSKY